MCPSSFYSSGAYDVWKTTPTDEPQMKECDCCGNEFVPTEFPINSKIVEHITPNDMYPDDTCLKCRVEQVWVALSSDEQKMMIEIAQENA